MSSDLERALALLRDRPAWLAAPVERRLAQLVTTVENCARPESAGELAALLAELEAGAVLEARSCDSPADRTSDPRIPRFEDSHDGEDDESIRRTECAECGSEMAPEDSLDVNWKMVCVECIVTGAARVPVRGDYALLGRLGAGGMGEVYKAVERPTRRIVAFKVLKDFQTGHDAELAVRFGREIAILSRLDHPNIVRFLAGGEIDGHLYLVMEFVPGKTLRKVLAGRGRLDPVRTIQVGYQVAKALEHAFSHKIVHRDLKPENIMIDREGRVRVIDLGLAKPMISAGVSGITGPDACLGTIPYMAPEQVEDSRHVDQRADVYSLGTILYETASGQRAFTGQTRLALIDRIRTGSYVPLSEADPDVPAAIQAVIERAMARDPQDRFQTPGEMRAAIKALDRMSRR
ncbi:MAG: serine/threonine protein kinase [Planctomycetes bacterium]|nr:serine/threonine protein kinase [Planctomycetota bacterium]